MNSYLDDAILESIIIQQPYDTADNIARGKAAMRRVILTHSPEWMAMFRKEIGWIGFEWGYEGEAPPDFKNHAEFRAWQKSGRRPFDKGGHGIAHIIAKRDWEGKHIEEFLGQKGENIAYKLVEIIVKGEISGMGRSANHVNIKNGGYVAGLNRKNINGITHWLITGYEKPASGYTYTLFNHDSALINNSSITESAGERSSFNDLTLRLRSHSLQLSVHAGERQTQAYENIDAYHQPGKNYYNAFWFGCNLDWI